MSKITGYSAFLYFHLMKQHLTNGKFNIREGRGDTKYIEKKWKKSRQGSLFFAVDKQIPRNKEKFERLFIYYWLENSKYHISDILKDELAVFNKYEFQYENIKDTVENDFVYILDYCAKKNITLKRCLMSNKTLPVIVQMANNGKISWLSFIVFDDIFGIFRRIKRSNLCSEKKKIHSKMKIIVSKCKEIIYYEKYDWKTFIKKII